MDLKNIEMIPNYDELSPKESNRKGTTTERRRKSLFPFKKVKPESDSSLFDIFGFGSKSIMNSNLRYRLALAFPQCNCRRLASSPITFNIEKAIKGNPRLKALPKQVKGERCTRFNQWWLKCCQSAVLRQEGIYWNLIQLLGLEVTVNSQKTLVSDLVLGKRITLAIDLDIKRTYPSLEFFDSYGRGMLRRILSAYAFFDTEVGYVQGLNFIVANLLWHSSEEQAFWALISMMYLYDMRCMFLPGLPGVFKRCEVLEHCMVKQMPRLHNHLKSVGVHIPMIASDWFMTLCANSVPIRALGRLWDSFFSEGWIAIFRFIVFRLKQFEEYLITMSDIADIMKVIKYGNANLTEKFHLIELIPGFSGVNRKRVELISAAYSSNVENMTNDPNKNMNDKDWVAIVEESLKCDIEASFIEKLELTNSEIMYFDIPPLPYENDLEELRSDAMASCMSSENSLMGSDDAEFGEQMMVDNEIHQQTLIAIGMDIDNNSNKNNNKDNVNNNKTSNRKNPPSDKVTLSPMSDYLNSGTSDMVESVLKTNVENNYKDIKEIKNKDVNNKDNINSIEDKCKEKDSREIEINEEEKGGEEETEQYNMNLIKETNVILEKVENEQQLENLKNDQEKELEREEHENYNKEHIEKAIKSFQDKLDNEILNRASNKDIPRFSDSMRILQENSLDDIASQLEELANTFRSKLDAICVSKAYYLHLKALQDEL